MMQSNNLAALIYLKNKVHKWKNIAFLFAIFAVILLLKIMSGSEIGGVIEEDAIASINIDQVIFEDDYRSKILKEIAEEKSIKAVVVNIDSPGGGIVGSEILYNDLRGIAAKKPIVVVMKSVAASGGYMAAIAADYIVAYNGTLTGSIGVLMESPEVVDLANKIGVKMKTYKSSPLKGSPSPFEKPSALVDQVIQESIADSYKFFADLVKERRGAKLNKKLLSKIFDGRVFTGRQAFEVGLIDKVGTQEDALKYLSENKIDVKNLPIREIEIVKKEKRFFDQFLNFLPFFNGAKYANYSDKIMAVMQ